MTIALIKQSWPTEHESSYFKQAEALVTMELDNVAHGLKHFSTQLQKTQSAQAQFALLLQLKTWALNKPTIQTLLEQYLEQVESSQQKLHLDPEGYKESIASLCEQLDFLSAVFEQESELIDQMIFTEEQMVLCD